MHLVGLRSAKKTKNITSVKCTKDPGMLIIYTEGFLD